MPALTALFDELAEAIACPAEPWRGPGSLVELFDALAGRITGVAHEDSRAWAQRMAAQLPPFTPAEVRRLVLLARRLDEAATR